MNFLINKPTSLESVQVHPEAQQILLNPNAAPSNASGSLICNFPHGSIMGGQAILSLLTWHPALKDCLVFTPRSAFTTPPLILMQLVRGLLCSGSGRHVLNSVLTQGRNAFLYAGGMEDLLRDFSVQDQETTISSYYSGYIKSCLEENKPLIPVYTFGMSDQFPYHTQRLDRFMFRHFGFVFPTYAAGLRWWIPCEAPSRLHMVIGKPIFPAPNSTVDSLRTELFDAIQEIYKEHKDDYSTEQRQVLHVNPKKTLRSNFYGGLAIVAALYVAACLASVVFVNVKDGQEFYPFYVLMLNAEGTRANATRRLLKGRNLHAHVLAGLTQLTLYYGSFLSGRISSSWKLHAVIGVLSLAFALCVFLPFAYYGLYKTLIPGVTPLGSTFGFFIMSFDLTVLNIAAVCHLARKDMPSLMGTMKMALVNMHAMLFPRVWYLFIKACGIDHPEIYQISHVVGAVVGLYMLYKEQKRRNTWGDGIAYPVVAVFMYAMLRFSPTMNRELLRNFGSFLTITFISLWTGIFTLGPALNRWIHGAVSHVVDPKKTAPKLEGGILSPLKLFLK